MAKKASKAGKELSKLGAAKGGRARAKSLSKDQRSEIARQAALVRWGDQDEEGIVRAICGSEDSPLVIGGIEIPCYVLSDERRVITLSGMQEGLGLKLGGGPGRLADYVGRIDPNSSTANELSVRLNDPIRFRPPRGGKHALGYEGSLLADICESILHARQQGNITRRYEATAQRAEILVRGFARIGIVALIDEVTGFQYVRNRRSLTELLERYISGQIMKWTKTFPDEFYIEMFRLKGWDYTNLMPGADKPGVVGYYTRNIVYQRMPPGLIHKLEEMNPIIAPGQRHWKHHQLLTEDIGHPDLREHIAKVITVMNLSEDWTDFRHKLRKVLPQRWEQYEFQDLFPDPNEGIIDDISDDGLD